MECGNFATPSPRMGTFAGNLGHTKKCTDQSPRDGESDLSTLNPTHMIRGLVACLAGLCLVPAQAQERIYRCGNEYTNNAEVAKSRGCKPMEGGNITVIQGPAPQRTVAPSAPRSSSAPARNGNTRTDSAEQRARDSDARAILETELRRAEERLAEAKKAYADGEPEKQGIESRNYQRYLDRVAELKAALARAESDVTSIRNELNRHSGAGTPAGNAAK